MPARLSVTGLILCGGRSLRMGGVDKGLQQLRGRALVEWVLDRLEPQVDEILISANQNLDRYLELGHPILRDRIGGFAGPLAGLHAALEHGHADLIVTAPCDSPFLPRNLVQQLQAALLSSNAQLAFAAASGQPHPVFSACRASVRESLCSYLEGGGRQVREWHATLETIEVSFEQVDAFRNVNTLEELEALQSDWRVGQSR